jgi:hypothetical protein
MSTYDLIVFIVAVIIGVPALGFWRVMTITGRMDQGDFGAEPEGDFG